MTSAKQAQAFNNGFLFGVIFAVLVVVLTITLSGCSGAIKEPTDFALLKPPAKTSWAFIDAEPVLRYRMLGNINNSSFENFAYYALLHKEVKRCIIDIHSPGGSLVALFQILGLMDELRSHGKVVETRCTGIAASAAMAILLYGDHSYVTPYSELMWHSPWTDKPLTPETTKRLAHFKKTLDTLLDRKCCSMTMGDIEERTKNKAEWWLTGEEAVELGIVDNYINKRD